MNALRQFKKSWHASPRLWEASPSSFKLRQKSAWPGFEHQSSTLLNCRWCRVTYGAPTQAWWVVYACHANRRGVLAAGKERERASLERASLCLLDVLYPFQIFSLRRFKEAEEDKRLKTVHIAGLAQEAWRDFSKRRLGRRARMT